MWLRCSTTSKKKLNKRTNFIQKRSWSISKISNLLSFFQFMMTVGVYLKRSWHKRKKQPRKKQNLISNNKNLKKLTKFCKNKLLKEVMKQITVMMKTVRKISVRFLKQLCAHLSSIVQKSRC